MCIKQTPTFDFLIRSIAFGFCRAKISLIIATSISMTSFITSGLYVSIEIAISEIFFIASIIGTILFNSSSVLTGSDPGRVDSPPISMISTPSSIILSARFKAALESKYIPPSENESGVIFKIPITSGRFKSKECLFN